MCYSPEIIKFNFIFNVITCYFLFNYKNDNITNNYKIISLFYLGVGFMQLFDYIFWLNQEKNTTNYIFTKIAMIVTYLHPLLLAIYIHMYNGLDNFSIKLSIIYFIILIIQIISKYNYVDYTLVNKEYNILNWKWTYNNLIFFYIIYLLYGNIIFYNNINNPLNIISMIIFTFTCLISILKYKKENFGIMWCKISSLVPLLYLLL